jgi:hypothetical protein
VSARPAEALHGLVCDLRVYPKFFWPFYGVVITKPMATTANVKQQRYKKKDDLTFGSSGLCGF